MLTRNIISYFFFQTSLAPHDTVPSYLQVFGTLGENAVFCRSINRNKKSPYKIDPKCTTKYKELYGNAYRMAVNSDCLMSWLSPPKRLVQWYPSNIRVLYSINEI